MSTPTEFVLWLNGAVDVMGDYPTPEQWRIIKEKLNESVGFIAAKKLLERAEDQLQIARDPMNMYHGQPFLGVYNPPIPTLTPGSEYQVVSMATQCAAKEVK
jgi:hypothetical protein